MTNKFKKILLSLAILFVVIITLGIPYKNWGFKTDDFGNIQHCVIKDHNDVLKFFYEGNIEKVSTPSNALNNHQAFFAGLFRPMSFIYYLPQYYFFKTNAYGYFLVTIIFHALNAALLFYIFSFFISLGLAFFVALFFAYHPSLHNWIGWISAQTYFIELFVFLLLLIFLKKYLDTKKIYFYLLSIILFLANLYLKEATIVLPFWIIFATYFYLKSKKRFSKKVLVKKSIKTSIGFWAISIFYLITRAMIFPLTSNTSTLNFEPNLTSFTQRMSNRFFDLVSYVSDFLGLNWLPASSQILKGTLIILTFLTLFSLFINNRKKSFLTFLLFSTILFSWPVIIQYQPRYIYLSIPFFILFVISSFRFSTVSVKQKHTNKDLNKQNTSHKKLNVKMVIILFCIVFMCENIKKRETVLHMVTKSFKELAQNETILNHISKNNSLCFMQTPVHWFGGGTAQAMWLLTDNDSYPVYCVEDNIRLKNVSNYRQIPKTKKNLLKITPTANGFKFKTLNKNKLWFTNTDEEEVQIVIPKNLLKTNPLFITWDYQKAKFVILEKTFKTI